jgi:hypothetical protein
MTHQMELLDEINQQDVKDVNSMEEFSLFCSIITMRNMDAQYIHHFFLQRSSTH